MLRDAGLTAVPAPASASGPLAQSVEIELRDAAVHDLVVDAVVHLQVGLVRMQRRQHHLAEVFQEGVHVDPR
jgi:ABC-2 type transport system ATP-binding protein